MTKRTLPELVCTALAGAEFRIADEARANWNAALQATAAADDNVVSILDPIGEGFTAKRMAGALRSIGERDVTVHINSPGGLIDEGTAIYNMLRQHKGEVNVKILGMAGSIASIIAMAGDSIEIAKAGFVYVHNGEGVAIGNRHTMAEMQDALKEFDAMMNAVYADRSGQTTRAVERLMDGRNNGGTLMGSAAAIGAGFADKLLPGDEVGESAARKTARADILAIRKLEALATSQDHASRSEFLKLLNEIKGGMRDAAALETGTRDAAEDAMRDAGVNAELSADLRGIGFQFHH